MSLAVIPLSSNWHSVLSKFSLFSTHRCCHRPTDQNLQYIGNKAHSVSSRTRRPGKTDDDGRQMIPGDKGEGQKAEVLLIDSPDDSLECVSIFGSSFLITLCVVSSESETAAVLNKQMLLRLFCCSIKS